MQMIIQTSVTNFFTKLLFTNTWVVLFTEECDNLNCNGAHVSGYNFINAQDQGIDSLTDSIANQGPHTIYLYVNSNFQFYTSGIFDDISCSKLSYNHAVVNVGYDKVQGYWLLRNSWSASWGENGHIRIAMGQNICNSEHFAWIPFAWEKCFNVFFKLYQ